MTSPPEPTEARPWRPEDGPEPRVTAYPTDEEPALWVWTHGEERFAVVQQRQDWPDGRVSYDVVLRLPPDNGSYHRSYWWPQEGLRVAHGPGDRRRRGSQAIDGT